MNKKMKLLNSLQMSTLKKKFGVLHFRYEFDLIYENQIPNTGIALVNGEIILNKKSKTVMKIKPGFLMGIHELINSEMVKLGCKVSADSEIIIINKSDILSAFEDDETEIMEILRV
jgi:hypothetical protein